MALALAVAAAVVAAEFSAELVSRTRKFERGLAQKRSTIRRLGLELKRANQRLDANRREASVAREVARILLADDLKKFTLAGSADQPETRSLIAISRKADGAVLQARGLEPSREGQVYAVWWLRAPAGAFKGAEFRAGPRKQTTVRLLSLPPALPGAYSCIVTLEDEVGRSRPGSKVRLEGRVEP